MALSRSASANANGPGASGSVGGCGGSSSRAAVNGANAQRFSFTSRQQTKARRPCGLIAFLIGEGAHRVVEEHHAEARKDEIVRGVKQMDRRI